MHIIEIATCTPDGQHLHSITDTTLGDHLDAQHRAYELAAAVTIDLHAQDPCTAHAHLIAINGQCWTVIATRSGTAGRTDLLATLADLTGRHT